MSKSSNSQATAPVDVEVPAPTDEPTVEAVPVIGPAWSIEAYRAGDAKVKGKIRSDLDKAFKAAVANGDLPAAQAIMAHQALLVASKSDKATVPTEVTVAARIATLRLAADLLEAGSVRPEGIESADPVGIAELVAGRYVPGDLDAAKKVAAAKITKSGPQTDVGAVIEHAFEDVEVGTFLTVRQICAKSEYKHDGAVAARLFPRSGEACNVPGIVPVDTSATSGKGARKV